MQDTPRLALLALASLVAIPTAGAAPAPLAFHAPASYHAASLETHTGSWALLVFRNGTAADLDLASAGGVHLSNDTLNLPLVARRPDERHQVRGQPSHSERDLPGPLSLAAGFAAAGESSVLVVADRIDLALAGASGTFRTKPAGQTLEDFSRPADVEHELYRRSDAPGGDDVVLTASPAASGGKAPFHLSAERAASIEWYNADVRCAAQDCPDGGGPDVDEFGALLDYSVTSESHSYETLAGEMRVDAKGTLDYAVLGTAGLTVFLDGDVRLPLASVSGLDCSSCMLPDRQTLAVSGHLALTDLRMAPGGDIQGGLGGDLDSARVDETPIDPALLRTGGIALGAAAVLGGGLLVLHHFLGPLFTWNRDEDLLANPRRRRIHDFILANPGAHIREVLRAAGVPAGAGRHHVNRLVEAGLLMAQRSDSVVLLFENHGKYRDSWRRTATLRDESARVLHAWVSAHPSSPQKDILDAFQAERGWNRSTTQKRLERLQRDGLVEARPHGRYKVYAPVAAPVPPPLAIAAPIATPG
jgi:predicted transcriptional regulator